MRHRDLALLLLSALSAPPAQAGMPASGVLTPLDEPASPSLPASALEAPGSPPPPPPAPAALTVDQCVQVALRGSGKLSEASARVREYQARLREVEALYYPKLQGLAFLAPSYSVRGSALGEVDTAWSRAHDWGPYTHLEARLAQPLYTFGRLEAGREAAAERLEVERARLREARNVLALEVRKLYYTHLYARGLLPVLTDGRRAAGEALEAAQAKYEAGTGEVTQVDLMKIRYGLVELDRYLILTAEGAKLSLAALKHTMGQPDGLALELTEERLPLPAEAPLPPLATLKDTARRQRPEWAQIEHGRKAAHALERTERLADAPVLFLGGELRLDHTPTRDDATNPYHYDPYNQVTGGVALGMLFDLDPWKSRARADQARAVGQQVEALEEIAETGIPLQVGKAWAEVRYWQRLSELSLEGVSATSRWMVFALSAFKSGTGEARDVLEGLAAHIQARRSQAESLLHYHLSRAELTFALGEP